MQKPSSSELWRQIAPLRGLAICLVVVNHASQSATGAFVTHHTRLSPFEEPIAFMTINVIRAFTPICLILFLFAMDFFIAGTTKVWWKLAPLFASDAPIALAQQALPRSFADASLWLTPLLGVVGLLGPLRTMALARGGREAKPI